MPKSSFILLASFILFWPIAVGRSADPVTVPWSSKKFGPDGPWQAVSVQIGSDAQALNLYPGGTWQSYILEMSGCNGTSVCYAEDAGSIFNAEASTTFVGGEVEFPAPADFSKGVLDIQGVLTTMSPNSAFSSDDFSVGGISVESVDMALFKSLTARLPDGSTYPIEVGSMSLGNGDVNQTFSQDNKPGINYTMLPAALWTHGITNSNSWGMHIGSVQPAVSPSLILGGYDQIHVLSPVSTMSGSAGTIDLLDIEINVVQGASPFKANFTSLPGLLANDNTTIQTAGFLTIAIEPLVPYLSLPKSTCDAIASQLPVTYQSKYGLYFWDTTDPLYELIVSSASALVFIFRKDGSNAENITISIPFLLLNLTLTEPIISPNTQYFPCNAREDDDAYHLGRAFLQVAFIGANLNSKVWWLAQAPGPDSTTTSVIKTIKDADTTITPSESDWTVSWSRSWNALSYDASSSATASTILASSSSSSSGTSSAMTTATTSSLSTGAKAGIGAGVGISALAAILGSALYFMRRHRTRSNISYSGSANPTMSVTSDGYHDPNALPGELEGLATMPVIQDYYKPSTMQDRAELAAEGN